MAPAGTLNKNISLEQYPAGLYMAKIIVGNAVKEMKLIKEQ
jgi:hypothetical protein